MLATENNPHFDNLGVKSDSNIGRLLGLDKIEQLYDSVSGAHTEREFIERVLQRLGTCYSVRRAKNSGVPKAGKLIVVSNHPYGALDGMILTHFLLGYRTDLKVLTNYILSQISELSELFLPVDPFGGRDAGAKSFTGLRSAVHWLESDHVLAAFPSGTVSHFQWRSKRVEDPKWRNSIARLAERTEADVLPIHISGQNSRMFQLASMIHPKLRTALLLRELLNKRGSHVTLRVGEVVPYAELKFLRSRTERTDRLRAHTMRLGQHLLT